MNKKTLGMSHLALTVEKLEACRVFYTKLLNMDSECQPDDDNIYLTSGRDNLALHRAPKDFNRDKHQSLDHLGFFIATENEVDEWYDFFVENNVTIKAKPRTHRDGARSFYCADPDGNVVQLIYHPNITQ